MVYGIGVDLASIARVEKACARQGFLERVYSPEELRLFAGDAAKLAGNFAAKEAFSKALGTGVRGFSLSEAAVLRDELGKPYYAFSGAAAALMEEKGLAALLTLSDEGDTVAAVALLEQR